MDSVETSRYQIGLKLRHKLKLDFDKLTWKQEFWILEISETKYPRHQQKEQALNMSNMQRMVSSSSLMFSYSPDFHRKYG